MGTGNIATLIETLRVDSPEQAQAHFTRGRSAAAAASVLVTSGTASANAALTTGSSATAASAVTASVNQVLSMQEDKAKVATIVTSKSIKNLFISILGGTPP